MRGPAAIIEVEKAWEGYMFVSCCIRLGDAGIFTLDSFQRTDYDIFLRKMFHE